MAPMQRETFIQGAPRPAALAVSEDGLDPSGVDITSWAFFANEGAPSDVVQAWPRPAALAVTEDGLDPSGVDMTLWAFFANEGAPHDYVQARPGTGVNDLEPEPESDLDRRAESDSSSGPDSKNFTVDAESYQEQNHGAWLWPTQVAFKAAAVAPVAHPAFTTAAAPTSPMDLGQPSPLAPNSAGPSGGSSYQMQQRSVGGSSSRSSSRAPCATFDGCERTPR